MVSSPRRGPSVSASRTSIQPLGTFHVVTSVLVPGSYARDAGTLIANRPSGKEPPSRSSSVPKTLGESKLGTHSQSIAPSGATSAPVWQSDRNAYCAIGGNGDGAAALWGVAVVGSSTEAITPPTARASGRVRPGGGRPHLAPRCPSRRDVSAAARRAAAASTRTPPSRTPAAGS